MKASEKEWIFKRYQFHHSKAQNQKYSQSVRDSHRSKAAILNLMIHNFGLMGDYVDFLKDQKSAPNVAAGA